MISFDFVFHKQAYMIFWNVNRSLKHFTKYDQENMYIESSKKFILLLYLYKYRSLVTSYCSPIYSECCAQKQLGSNNKWKRRKKPTSLEICCFLGMKICNFSLLKTQVGTFCCNQITWVRIVAIVWQKIPGNNKMIHSLQRVDRKINTCFCK